jgi:hypothetical protein
VARRTVHKRARFAMSLSLKVLAEDLKGKVLMLPEFHSKGYSDDAIKFSEEFSDKFVSQCDWSLISNFPGYIGCIWDEDLPYFLPNLVELSAEHPAVLARLVDVIQRCEKTSEFSETMMKVFGTEFKTTIDLIKLESKQLFGD